jgi:hypothetical protein
MLAAAWDLVTVGMLLNAKEAMIGASIPAMPGGIVTGWSAAGQ